MKPKSLFGYVTLLQCTFIGLTTCLIPSMESIVDGHYNNSTTFAYATSGNPFKIQSPLSSMSSGRTARKGGKLQNACTTNDGASGTCMSRFNCMRLGGTVRGFCASYGGICCETNLQCGQTSRLKRTIIRNPVQLPNSDCFYEIEAYNSNVCQLLVEFENFELLQPTLTGSDLECTDYMQIGEYILCGVNSQQHLYIPFNVANVISRVPLNFHIPSRWAQTNWRLVITQLECPAVKRRMNWSFLPFVTDNSLNDARTVFDTHNSDLDLLAPPGCDQYYRQQMGTIRSFNYNQNVDTYYTQNLNYVICIKAVTGATMVEYTMRRFSLSSQVSTNPGFDTNCHATIVTDGRREDYLMLPGAVIPNNEQLRPSYFCGNSFDERAVVLATAPFIMYFASDGYTDTTETGFSVDYRIKSVLG